MGKLGQRHQNLIRVERKVGVDASGARETRRNGQAAASDQLLAANRKSQLRLRAGGREESLGLSTLAGIESSARMKCGRGTLRISGVGL